MGIKKDRVDLICSIGELSGLFNRTDDLSDFLDTVVSVVAYHMHAAVCSVYLWDEEKKRLVLSANQGLNPNKIGQVELELGQGLVGLAVKELRAICEGNALKSPGFILVPELEEERFCSFLTVPILRGLNRLGALVVQDPQADYFDENDSKALQAISAQLAATIENANILISLYKDEKVEIGASARASELPPLLKGIGISPGFVSGQANVVGPLDALGDLSQNLSDAGTTLPDFETALEKSALQLENLQLSLEENQSDVSSMIFSAQLLMLKDSQFSGAMIRLIETGCHPGDAVSQIVNRYTHLFSQSKNIRLREKVQDVKDIGHRILLNLHKSEVSQPNYQNEILITDELMPSDIVKYNAQQAAGIVMVGGTAGSHVAILARSLDLPMVIMSSNEVFSIKPGTPLLVDAEHGSVFINPEEGLVAEYQELMETHQDANVVAQRVNFERFTASGERIRLYANVNLLNELTLANKFKAEGIGLYRSEFPFIVRNSFPSEEEQFRIYRTLFERMKGKPVVIRTLDIGGDKMLSYFPSVNEENPFLGLRALRFTLRYREVFDQQLRAILRAGHGGDLHIMFPMVSSLDDFLAASEIVRDCQNELMQADIPYHSQPQLGPMIELPSAVEIIDELAQQSDFLCIGTNDLVQYILAVDRTNKQISDMYVPYHPAVLRSLKRIVDAAQRWDKPVTVCGETARDPRMLPFLVGIGIRSLSTDARWLPRMQTMVSELDVPTVTAQADHMLGLARLSELKAYIDEQMGTS